MWLSSIRAFAANAPGVSCGFSAYISLSAQAVSFLKATNPPSLSGTINWRLGSCAAAAKGHNENRSSRPNSKGHGLLIIVVTPLDDGQLYLIGGSETREIC